MVYELYLSFKRERERERDEEFLKQAETVKMKKAKMHLRETQEQRIDSTWRLNIGNVLNETEAGSEVSNLCD